MTDQPSRTPPLLAIFIAAVFSLEASPGYVSKPNRYAFRSLMEISHEMEAIDKVD
ncbi:hypothetical protein [Corallococcus carmarthensis]|uniref:hypothetical protein n=1 Tax=Corallococcus carmarthensis TaxID=2316728 RepID=UPI00148B83C4|nr:hypothetical protein [Corallococcus carmarthensis]NOK18870.1 hypothetical protein [Corallococcus carmarthensis]